MRKKWVERLGHLGLRIDVAVQHPAPELLRRGVDELDLVGLAHDPVRHPFADLSARHLLDGVGDAFEVLDIDGRDHVDAGVEDIQHVLPTLGVRPDPGTLVWASSSTSGNLGMAAQHGVEIHLVEPGAPVLDGPPRNDFETVDQLFGVRAAV